MSDKDLTSKPSITLLGEELINQIAAGEVVERPSSVVKELIENSLDAGATKIDILILEGGLKEITLIDNGKGMNEADIKLCLLRHATSKIHTANDLEAIGSFGFRGEALASIAAVSELEIRSRTANMKEGYVIRSAFGKTDPPVPEAVPQGTAVSIKNIFSLLPARKKFLRSDSTEFSHCAKMVREVALGHPETAFHLFHQGRAVAHYVGTNRVSRFKEILKPSWTPIHLLEEGGELRMEALLSPAEWLDDKGELFLFINGRPVRNRPLLGAVRQSYREVMGPHHDPSGVVFLDLALESVDVNVHPQKWEVRCLKQERIYHWMTTVLRKRLTQTQGVRTAPIEMVQKVAELPPIVRETESVDEVVLPLQELPSFSPSIAKAVTQQTQFLVNAMKEESLRYLGQVKASYLLCEDDSGIVLVDQHALQEKLFFEKVKAKGAPDIQRFLVPKILPLTPDLRALLDDERIAVLEKMGFEVQPFSDGDIAIKSAPALLEDHQIETIVREAIRQEVSGEATLDAASLLTPLFATTACHSAIRANQRISEIEARALLKNLTDIEAGWTCPHGRPILFRLSFDSIAKYFERT